MGTQQILLIVLSVIIVGVAVSVGIQMFQTQKNSAEVQSISSDLQGYGAQLVSFMNTPTTMGGAKNATTAPAVGVAGKWLGWTETSNTVLTNNNATYTITAGTTGYVITVSGGTTVDGATVSVVDATTAPAVVL